MERPHMANTIHPELLELLVGENYERVTSGELKPGDETACLSCLDAWDPAIWMGWGTVDEEYYGMTVEEFLKEDTDQNERLFRRPMQYEYQVRAEWGEETILSVRPESLLIGDMASFDNETETLKFTLTGKKRVMRGE